jgi:hypothetical protein
LIEAFICDIDGTVADHTGLRGHFEYEKVHLDKPIWPVISVVRAITWHHNWLPLFVSGRMDETKDGVSVRESTVDWIEDKLMFSPWECLLYMRADQDFRPDDVIKKEIYHAKIENNFHVNLVLDDRNRVVDMWRRLGLQCLQVAPGDF